MELRYEDLDPEVQQAFDLVLAGSEPVLFTDESGKPFAKVIPISEVS